jgi:hypothetical protein
MSVLVIACGALAREIRELQRANGWKHMALECLPATLHNTPEEIPAALRRKLDRVKGRYDQIFVAYGDCGTGGLLDVVLEEYGVERLPGAHCYEFFAGSSRFAAFAEEEMGTFYLTDFLVRHFDRLVFHGLGLDRNPQLLPMYFGNYRKLVYLAQTRSEELEGKARECALRLGLTYDYHYTGLDGLAATLAVA